MTKKRGPKTVIFNFALYIGKKMKQKILSHIYRKETFQD